MASEWRETVITRTMVTLQVKMEQTCVAYEPEGIVWFATNYTNRLP